MGDIDMIHLWVPLGLLGLILMAAVYFARIAP
jgi:hypothetical protein